MPDLTPEQDAKVREYAEAFRQEFAESTKDRKDPNTQRQDIQDQLDDVVPDAIASIKWIIRHSLSETQKLRASQWLLNLKLEKEAVSNDPLAKLLEEMQATAPANTSARED